MDCLTPLESKMSVATAEPEIVNYGGRECLAVHVEQISYRPETDWMPESVWNQFLKRNGVDDPERAHFFHNPGASQCKMGCECGQSVDMLTCPYNVREDLTISLMMGQCQKCRLINWGQVKALQYPIRFTATPSPGRMGTRLIE